MYVLTLFTPFTIDNGMGQQGQQVVSWVNDKYYAKTREVSASGFGGTFRASVEKKENSVCSTPQLRLYCSREVYFRFKFYSFAYLGQGGSGLESFPPHSFPFLSSLA
jgi:hypothetical protein